MNTLADPLLGSEDEAVLALMHLADERIGHAEEAFTDHRYADAVAHARAAYDATLDAAALAGLEVSGSGAGWRLDSTGLPLPGVARPDYPFVDVFER